MLVIFTTYTRLFAANTPEALLDECLLYYNRYYAVSDGARIAYPSPTPSSDAYLSTAMTVFAEGPLFIPRVITFYTLYEPRDRIKFQ